MTMDPKMKTVVPPQDYDSTPPMLDYPTAASEVVAVARRRHIVYETNACTEPGSIGALPRREGLCRSHLSKWRIAFYRILRASGAAGDQAM